MWKLSGWWNYKDRDALLPDVYVPCDVCHGTRYNRETLDVKFKGKNIAEVLDMRVSEAIEFFDSVPKIKTKLQTMIDVGLPYIKLGQLYLVEKQHELNLRKNYKRNQLVRVSLY